ncbi:MAG: prolyl oligopeptidase family serine peptidase [Bacteroidetes bacterium]|nr:prolyl oligopeptidase family serine peptidase [Bacteroidota bacterium]MBU1579989.1 prolyl oligopeptidase family serine peptidase [Bacteroidota bacterium]MBU2559020.1 prolyl oligopeptidase family serine peptidase [Bacteroidota bacterium]
MIKYLLIVLLATLFVPKSKAQNCIELNHTQHQHWFTLQREQISNDGHWFVYERNPYRGDGHLIIQHLDKNFADTLERAKAAKFSAENDWLAYTIYPAYDSVKKLQLDGIKKDKLPKDSLGIFDLATRKLEKLPAVKSFRYPVKAGNLLVWLHESDYTPEMFQQADSLEKKNKKKAKKDDPAWLGLRNPETGEKRYFKNVSHYELAEKSNTLFFASKAVDSIDSLVVYRYRTNWENAEALFSTKGQIKSLATDLNGNQLAIVFTPDTVKRKIYQLAYWTANQQTNVAIDTVTAGMPADYSLSEHGKIAFSDDGSTLYVGLAPKPLPIVKDSLTDDEKVSLDIWNWKDQQLQTQQLKRLSEEKKRNYLAAWYPENRSLVPLENEMIPSVRTELEQNPKYLLGRSSKPYEYLFSWEQTRYTDYYRIDRLTGDSLRLLTKANSTASLNPSGEYLLFYDRNDSLWKSLEIDSRRITSLTSEEMDVFYNDENDVPNEAGPLGLIGWTSEGNALVYSKYDIWELNPEDPKLARKITSQEAEIPLKYRYAKTDFESFFVPDEIFLTVFNELSKKSGYAKLDRASGKITNLIYGAARFSRLKKAKMASRFLWTKETFSDFPDWYTTDKRWKKPERLTYANPQQQNYCWGTVELVSWTTYEGKQLDGLMYLPAGYQPEGDYPMLVYFYERYSDDLYRHYAPKPSRSVINFSDYTSKGYAVFVPDITYETTKPGQSAYDAVMSGVDFILEAYPAIDSNRMGLQGQSWGGYQTAWLITRTNRFNAAMAGAPVSNMTSAYGGIRWSSGLSRAFQYEDGQSRIGGDLWTNLDDYIENSPLFFADQVETPLLMMHNDADGAVPWYQGIEYFSALRRLGKPVWMLVYNNAPHNLSRFADTQDLTIRLEQFFDHFLKGAPEPVWMQKGIKAIDKGRDFGFELVD